MSTIDPISDAYINSLIKSAETDNPYNGRTLGRDLRTLLKMLRDRFEQQVSGVSFTTVEPDANGIVLVQEGVEEVTAARDLILDVKYRTPGLSGELYVLQDATGLHNVTLAPGNIGLVTPVATAPGALMKLTWQNLSDSTTWVAELIGGPKAEPVPQAVTTLKTTLIDAGYVQVTFLSPIMTDDINQAADKYHFYISQGPITDTTNLAWLSEYSQSKIPAKPGILEVLNLSNLSPKQLYYLVMTAEITVNGKTYVTPMSNIIFFTTISSDAQDNPTNDVTIPVDPAAIYTYQTAFDKDTDGTVLDPHWLVDYRNVSVTDGTPSGYGDRMMRMVHTDSFVAGWYNQDEVIVFDLGGVWNIHTIWAYNDTYGSALVFQTSPDGNTWADAVTLSTSSQGINQWISGAPLTANTNVRYIRMTFAFEVTVRNVLFRGVRASAQALSGIKYKRGAAKLNLSDLTGVNSFAIEPGDKIAEVAKVARFYHSTDWFTSPGNPSMAQGGNATPDTMKLVFQHSRLTDQHNVSVNFDTAYQAYQSAGTEILFCLVQMPLWLAPSGMDPNKATTRKPLDAGLDMTLLNTTNPNNYKAIARFFWNVAARYGSTTLTDTSLLKLEAGEEAVTGLGVIKYMEIGQNECDLTYPDANRFTNPQELAAMMSAIYDGHLNTMGAGYGVKNVDPNMICAMPGLSGTQFGYVEAMFKWWDANRGPGNYPLDVVNQHWYNTNIGSQNIYGQANVFSYPPEMGVFVNYTQAFVDKRDRTVARQREQFWITETGYDEHYGSAYSAQSTDPVERGRKKAIWNLRNFLIGDWLGIDKVFIYAFEGTKLLSEFSNTIPDTGSGFATAGYFDGQPGTLNKQPLTSYYYSKAFRAAVQGYQFSHAIRTYGQNKVVTALTSVTDNALFMLAYKPIDTTQKGLIIAWLGDDQLRTLNLQLTVGASEATVKSINFEDLYTSHAVTGNTENLFSSQEPDGQKLQITVSNTPTLFFTDNLGVPVLIDPQDIKIESPSPTTVRLVWTDQNIGQNKTKIFRAQDSSENAFVTISDVYIDDAQFVDSNLSQATSYFYKIQFENGAVQSAVSDIYGITTARVIPAPGNLQVLQQLSDSIKLGWTYGTDDTLYITGFEVWRSNDAAGQYAKLTTLAPSVTTYTDTGLATLTTYYYKVRAIKDFTNGPFSLATGVTTDPASAQPPHLLQLTTNYAGDKLVLTYDLPMSNPAGNEGNYTVISGSATHHNVVSASLSPGDNHIIFLVIEDPIDASASAITLGYDGNFGNVQSVYGVKAASLTNAAVTNLIGSSSLLSRLIKINLTDATHASATGSFWNDLVFQTSGNTQLLASSIIDGTGAQTSYHFLVPIYYPYSDINSVPTDPSFASSADPINGVFPAEVRLAGLMVQSYYQGLEFALLKADTTKEYNIKLFGTFYPGNGPGTLTIVPNQLSGQAKTLDTADNKSNFAYLTSLQPSVQVLDVTPGSESGIDGYSLPMISIKCSALTSFGTIMAMIIEEVFVSAPSGGGSGDYTMLVDNTTGYNDFTLTFIQPGSTNRVFNLASGSTVSVPPGTYRLQITPAQSHQYKFTVGSQTQTNNGADFSGVVIGPGSADLHLKIENP